MALNPDEHRLSETEHQAIFEKRIKPTLFLDVLPSSSERPIAIIFGGQPGAGKSSALATAKSELESKGGAIEIIG
ncbi:zeta toxin family protein, partial [Aeromonas caviae]